MKAYIDPGRRRPSINFIDSIVYSETTDLTGNPMKLEMSIMLQNGNSEMKAAAGIDDMSRKNVEKPAILWVPGGGYRGADKNLMVAEVAYLAEAGYVVASMYYRSSAEEKYPSQLKDVKTAIRFLRAHAVEYEIDPEHIGIMGRSAGGHLSAMAGMNTKGYDTEEWGEFSSDVQAVYDMFGPVDFIELMEADEIAMKNNPNHRWKCIEDTHAGALLGGNPKTMKERAVEACVANFITSKTAPMLIMHGDADPLVPLSISECFYSRLCDAGLETQTEFYVLKNGGHGTPEFFQPETKEIVLRFFDKYLKNSKR